MSSGGAHCTVLSKHCASEESSTDGGSSNDVDDDINSELLDDIFVQREPIEGHCVHTLCHYWSNLQISAKVRTVAIVYQKSRAGDL